VEKEIACVIERIPRRIARIGELAYNFWWSWHREARDLFKMLDYPLWRSTGHNPVAVLQKITSQRLAEIVADPAFLRQYDSVILMLDYELANGHLWFPKKYPDMDGQPVAYFSAEFGVHSSLAIYSGGLGVLAGDHLKETSDLGIPFVGVGFLYERGYFRQRLSADGWQEAIYPRFEPDSAAVCEVVADNACICVPVEVGDRTVYVKVWQVQVGRTRLYLMDADHDMNDPWDRELTATLYGGDQEMRIRQEVVLGIGGLRILRRLGINPRAFHVNEGHSAFLALERARELVEAGHSFDEAAERIRSTTVFTTHTPVAAGHDVFPFHLMEKYFHAYWPSLGLTREQFLQLGIRPDDPNGFNMTVLALRLAGHTNGVSKLHGEISRLMFHSMWPDKPVEEVPISHVTNGVHVASWVGNAMNRIYRKYLGPDWVEHHDDRVLWERILDVPDEEVWAAHFHLKTKLMTLIRERARQQRVQGQMSAEQLLCAGILLDPDALVIGFARRFASYKRAALILSDMDRLKRLLHDPYRPLQLVFSGKAHPADEGGKRLLQEVYNVAKDPNTGGRIAFIEDYDMQVARYLVQGVDVWLNTPLSPHEASGTSGQKAAANGVPNLSILDGWWAEGYNGSNGWAIDPGCHCGNQAEQDRADADALYTLLEQEVVPLYYRRDSDSVPREWVAAMKEAIRTSIPYFTTRRMVKEYAEKYYVPAMKTA